MTRDDFRKMLQLCKEDLQGFLYCIWDGKHLLEHHDMGGGEYCVRCMAGTAVNPSYELPSLPSEPISDI